MSRTSTDRQLIGRYGAHKRWSRAVDPHHGHPPGPRELAVIGQLLAMEPVAARRREVNADEA